MSIIYVVFSLTLFAQDSSDPNLTRPPLVSSQVDNRNIKDRIAALAGPKGELCTSNIIDGNQMINTWDESESSTSRPLEPTEQ